MNLFNEYYSSEMQFMLTIFALNRPFSLEEACRIAEMSHIYSDRYRLIESTKSLLDKWVNNDLLKIIEAHNKTLYAVPTIRDTSNALNKIIQPFVMPINNIESEYLTEVLKTKEAALFFDKVPDCIKDIESSKKFSCIRNCYSQGRMSEFQTISHDNFTKIIHAIYERKRITYSYTTRTDSVPKICNIIPYRIEFSVFDGRWWLILYDEEKDDTVKARLQNIHNVSLSVRHNIDEAIIKKAIKRHLSEQYAVLQIKNQNNAFERCYMLFEDMPDMSSKRRDSDKAELKFRFFDWDKELIIKKLLYLGKYVTLVEPKEIVNEVIYRLKNSMSGSEKINSVNEISQ